MKSTETSTKAIAKEEKKVAEEISPRKKAGFPIVGIGSSAGGIEALKQFLKATPDRTGMAFVVVQHMSDSRKSLLPEVLQRSTAMPVSQAKDGTRVKRDHVYVMPPDKNMQMVRRTLRLFERRLWGLRFLRLIWIKVLLIWPATAFIPPAFWQMK